MPNPLNQYVDKVFVITSINSNRNTTLINHLNKHNIKFSFIVAPDYRLMSNEYKTDSNTIPKDKIQQHLLITLSQISSVTSIIELSTLNKYKNICIMENDVYFVDGWREKLNTFFNHVPNDYHILNIGTTYAIKDILPRILNNKLINKYVFKITKYYEGGHCVIFNSSIFSDLMKSYLSYKTNDNFIPPGDILLTRDFYTQPQYNCYTISTPCIFQTSYRGKEPTITKMIKDVQPYVSEILI